MRILMLRLKGYSGISSGLLRDEITIDFSHSMHKICLIKGATGSGKSTILEAITPLPNDNSMLDPTQQAEKEIVFNNGIRVLIIHPLTNKGERATTKAYIYENGVNLNPNGNVTSYRDIVFEKLELDSNFEALSKLSTRDRGLADKTPAIRKKYVASIIDSVEVYNNIYKNLTKHSNTLKSMLQSIVAKMDSIGDDKSLDKNIETLEALVKQYGTEKDKVTFNNASALAVVNTLDPDGSIMNQYNSMTIRLNTDNQTIAACDTIINGYEYSFDSISDVSDTIRKTEKSIDEYDTEIRIKKSDINKLIDSNDVWNESLVKKLKKLESITDSGSYDTLMQNIEKTQQELSDIEAFFAEINIHDALKLSSDDYAAGVNILRKITDDIIHFFQVCSYEDRCLLFNMGGVESVADDELARSSEIAILQKHLDELRSDIHLYESQISIYESLNKRPSTCKIDNCPFISNALNIGYNPIEELKKAKFVEQDCLNHISDHESHCILDDKLKNIGTAVQNILSFINGSINLLSKLPGTELLTNTKGLYEKLLTSVSYENVIPNFTLLYDTINKSYMFDSYKILREQYEKMLNQKAIFDSKHDVIDDLNSDIMVIKENLADIQKHIQSAEIDINNLNQARSKNIVELEALKKLLTTFETREAAIEDIKKVQLELDKISSNITKIREANATISATEETLKEIRESLKPVQNDLNRCRYNKKRLEEYKEEMEVYKERYEKTEVVKQYTSPTKEGIQLLFMEMYMNNILTTANNLLSKVFNGQFMLQPFIINGDEFRIPCVGNRLMNDDISSMSTGQICMISMILSFSILYNSSSTYNIIKLDEIDGGFDTDNRSSFISILNEIIDILGCQQCFLISHNEEIQYSATDMILLRTNSDNRDYGDANIIFDIRRD